MHFTARTWWEIGEDRYVIEERRIVENWSKSENRWLLFDRDGRHEFRFTLRLYAASELASHLRSAGFSSVRIFGGLDGRPYDRDARHLVALATA